MALADLKCELSWSASRAREFERCKREYWYARYCSWGWWTEDPPAERYAAMVHKNLTSLAALAGSCVHEAVATWFRRRAEGYRMDAQEIFEEARERFRQGWRQSQGGDWKARPNKRVHLEEHHYGLPLGEAETGAARATLEASARNFVGLPQLAPVRDGDPESWLAVEAMDTYVFLGTKVYAVPDFAFQEDGRIHIYDWKTGRPREEDRFQLLTYALYACEKWSADPEAIHLHAAYLREGRVQSFPVEIDELSAAQDRMSESVRAMMEVHYDPDEDAFVESHWPADGAPAACPRCRFRGICPEASAAE